VVFNYELAVEYLLLCGMSFLALTIFFCLFFAVRGPRLTDKIIATIIIMFFILFVDDSHKYTIVKKNMCLSHPLTINLKTFS